MADLGSIGSSGFITLGSNTSSNPPANGIHVSGSISFRGTVGFSSNTPAINSISKGQVNLGLIGVITGTSGEKSFTFAG